MLGRLSNSCPDLETLVSSYPKTPLEQQSLFWSCWLVSFNSLEQYESIWVSEFNMSTWFNHAKYSFHILKKKTETASFRASGGCQGRQQNDGDQQTALRGIPVLSQVIKEHHKLHRRDLRLRQAHETMMNTYTNNMIMLWCALFLNRAVFSCNGFKPSIYKHIMFSCWFVKWFPCLLILWRPCIENQTKWTQPDVG